MNHINRLPPIQKLISANDLEEYDPPEIHDLGDVSAITKSGFNRAGTDGGYS